MKAGHPEYQRGFALVLTLSIMSFVLLLLMTLVSLVQVESRSSQTQLKQLEAQQAALLGLNIAIGELQKTAGPDQRVTATASLLDDSSNLYTGGKTVPVGQASWTGLWRSDTVAVGTPSYSPKAPNTRSFVGWLVSSTDANGNYELPAALNEVAINVNTKGSTNGVQNYLSLFSKSDGTPYAQVEKVRFDSSSNVDAYFAFHVEDESVKADLSWSETPATSEGSLAQERAQARRLSAAPGPDFGALNGVDDNGPFGAVTYPLMIDSSATLDSILKTQGPADFTMMMSNASDASKWLKDNRADVTWGSRGVLADVKWGGLRRDLSLAFEMDGDADVSASDQPALFNQQIGEFVGGSDQYAASQAALGMNGIPARHVYRDVRSGVLPFSGDILTSEAVIRGPTWWAMRDYANLYKRLSNSGGSYSLDARSYYPNVSADVSSQAKYYNFGTLYGPNSGANPWDSVEYKRTGPAWVLPPDSFIYKPAKVNYAPVLLGAACMYSATAVNYDSNTETAELALGLDPWFYLWNPYNVMINVTKYAIVSEVAFPGSVTFWVNGEQFGPALPRDYLNAFAFGSNLHKPLTYLISNLSLEPGEVVVYSPSSSGAGTSINGELSPGTNTDNLSGVILNRIPVKVSTPNPDGSTTERIGWETVTLDLSAGSTDQVEFALSNKIGLTNQVGNTVHNAQYFFLRASLPDASVNAASLADPIYYGEQLQALDNNTYGSNAVPEYFYPGQTADPVKSAPVSATDLSVAKTFFGMVSYLAKPSSFDGNNPNPVEVFSQFNPAIVGGGTRLIWRPCSLNQLFNMYMGVELDPDVLKDELALNFPAASSGSSGWENGFWGQSYSEGSTAVPMKNLPTAPLISLASFANANLALHAHEPYSAVGNSWASPFVSPESPYDLLAQMPWGSITASDSSWLMNDALFDRYYLTGIAADYSIGGSGYVEASTLGVTLTNFFSNDYQSAQANPVLVPYLPDGVSTSDVVSGLSAADGYKQIAAYVLINGAFNVNSTSVPAWEAFLQGNRDVAVDYSQGAGANTESGTPFPSGSLPVAEENGAEPYWSGFSRLSDGQIRDLAEEIVEEVKLRGPFMSLSDFVNHRVGSPLNNATHYVGALQAAIEDSGINSSSRSGAGGVVPEYGSMSAYMPGLDPEFSSRVTSTGIATDITQADLLLPLAPRLTVRSDTFRIRAYGESVAGLNGNVSASAVCEAVVQRIPEYVDPETDPPNNEPWDEAMNPLSPSASALNTLNDQFGRRFKVVSLRWLSADEI